MELYDVVIIGAGPSGTSLACYLRLNGMKVLIIEKNEYPQFKIGESLLPASLEIFNEIQFLDKVDDGRYLRKHGALFIESRTNDEVYFDFTENELSDYKYAFEVERAKFDLDLLNHAGELGAIIRQPEDFISVEFYKDVCEIQTNKQKYRSQFIVDASGRASFLGKKLTQKIANPSYINNVGVYSHFENVSRDRFRRDGDIIIGILPNKTWCWLIPFHGNKCSFGVVGQNISQNKDFYLEEKIQESPWLQEIFKNAKKINETGLTSNFSYASKEFAGDRWALAGDSAIFLDPIFSSGVHVGLSSARILHTYLLKHLKTGLGFFSENSHQEYQENLLKGCKRFHNLLQIFYTGDFIEKVNKISQRKNAKISMVSAVAGNMWDERNVLLKMGII